MAKFRWGIIGTGAVAERFVLGLRQLEDAEPVIVASRSRANAERFSAEYSIPNVAANYRDAVNLHEVDAFYVATPPSEHREHALLSINAGVPVLVEKPFAADARAAKEIVDAARAKSVFCMEAMWTRFLPLVQHLKKIVAAGEIGDCRVFTGRFCVPETPDPSKNVFNKNLGGGALFDRGVYPLSLASYLMGRLENTHSEAICGETGVDEDSTMLASHEWGGLSMVHASLRVQCPNDCFIMGTCGTIHVHAPIYRPFKMTISKSEGAVPTCSGRRGVLAQRRLFPSLYRNSLELIANAFQRKGSQTITTHHRGNGYHYQAEEVMRCVRAGKIQSDVMPLADSLNIIEAIDRARAQWRPSSS
jgi:predicted dehydrogenase